MPVRLKRVTRGPIRSVCYGLYIATLLPRLNSGVAWGWHGQCEGADQSVVLGGAESDVITGFTVEGSEPMSDSSKDRVEGKADQVKGKIKETVGVLRDDEEQQAEGQADQAKGDVKKGIAGLKDKVDNVIKKATR